MHISCLTKVYYTKGGLKAISTGLDITALDLTLPRYLEIRCPFSLHLAFKVQVLILQEGLDDYKNSFRSYRQLLNLSFLVFSLLFSIGWEVYVGFTTVSTPGPSSSLFLLEHKNQGVRKIPQLVTFFIPKDGASGSSGCEPYTPLCAGREVKSYLSKDYFQACRPSLCTTAKGSTPLGGMKQKELIFIFDVLNCVNNFYLINQRHLNPFKMLPL